MNRVNRKVEYALMALKYINQNQGEKLISAKEISEQTGSPFDATARVMQVMAHKGLLKSEQGPQGGYSIVRDLSTVSFHELLEMIIGPLGIVKCLQTPDCELVGQCNIQSPLTSLNNRLIDFYKSLNIEVLLNDQSYVVKPLDVYETRSARQ